LPSVQPIDDISHAHLRQIFLSQNTRNLQDDTDKRKGVLNGSQ
jgi:hypothetical protein